MTRPQDAERTILVVEDDEPLAELLRDRLADRGYVVWLAASAAQAETLAESVSPDLILVDLMLPDQHGLILCANLRKRFAAPIIVCSGTQRKDDAVLALELGAADFVPKPLSIDELEVRMQRAFSTPIDTAVASAEGLRRLGPLSIDLARRAVTVSDREVRTTPTEYRLLCTLAEHPNRVVSVKELAEAVWGYHDSSVETSVGVHLRRLRAKLKSAPEPSPALLALRGFGYRLAWDQDADED